jgi:release factor glutamine methyltransferase
MQYKDFLKELAKVDGFIFHPEDKDTCPRIVIESAILGLELDLNENVQMIKKHLHNATVEIVHKDWINWQSEKKYHVVVSNPPYVSPHELTQLDKSVKEFEPHQALVPMRLNHDDEYSAQAYKEIIAIAENVLLPEAWLFVELSPLQAEWIQIYVSQRESFNDLRTLKDISKKPRIFCAKKKKRAEGG